MKPPKTKAAFLIAFLVILLVLVTSYAIVQNRKLLNTDIVLLKIDSTLQQNNSFVNNSTIQSMSEMERRSEKPELADTYKLINPIVFQCNKKGQELKSLIEEKKQGYYKSPELKISGDDFKMLCDSTLSFGAMLRALIPNKNRFLPMPVDSINKNNATFFEELSSSAQLLLLSELENKIEISQNIFVEFVNSFVVEHVIYDKLEMLVSQNVKSLSVGDTLEITAGHGLFSNYMHEKVQIGGSVFTVGENGFVRSRIKMSKPGIYSLPVSLSYRNSAGYIISKTIMVNCIVK